MQSGLRRLCTTSGHARLPCHCVASHLKLRSLNRFRNSEISHRDLRTCAAATEAAHLIPSVKLNSGAELPLLGLGTWRATPDEVAESAVEAAIKAGYRHIDSASAYGNETGTGRGITNASRGGVRTRDEYFVVSKLNQDAHAADDVEKALQASLDKFGLTYLDLYLVHWPATENTGPSLDPPYKETWQAMESLVEKGLVKSIGVSNMTAKKLEDLLSYAKIPPAVNQIEVHPYWRNTTTIDYCKKHNIHVTAYSPLASIASTKEAGQKLVTEDPSVKEVADKYGKTPAQVVLRWLLQQDISAIPKAVTNSHIVNNLHIFDFVLTDEDMQKLSSLEHQERTCSGDFVVSEEGPYRSLDELWDGEGY